MANKHTWAKPRTPYWGEKMVAPEGVRLAGPGTRSKNPKLYDQRKDWGKYYGTNRQQR